MVRADPVPNGYRAGAAVGIAFTLTGDQAADAACTYRLTAAGKTLVQTDDARTEQLPVRASRIRQVRCYRQAI
jgi:hypothetical protein